MELRQLNYFVKVAETLSFSEAARNACVTQSTLSQQIRTLEGELGTTLFVRDSHNVDLTEAGRELLPYARQTLLAAAQCENRIHDLNKLAVGTLNIGVTYSFGPILTESVLTFMKAYPRIKLNIYYRPMSELMEMLAEREVDFVLAYRPSTPMAEIESHVLFDNKLAAVVRDHHPLADRKKVTIEELKSFELALPTRGLQARNALDEMIADYSKLKIRLELNEVHLLLNIIRQSNLVTVLAESTIDNEKGIVAVPIDSPDNEMSGCVHLLRDSYHKNSMREFIRLLEESLAVRRRRNGWI